MYFMFNLSLLTDTEKVVKSEVFINRKYIRQRLVFDLHYLVYSTKTGLNANARNLNDKKLKTGATMTIDLRNFQANRYNRQNHWQSFNILESVKTYLHSRNNQQTIKNRTSVYYTVNNNDRELLQSGDEIVLVMEAKNLFRRDRRRSNRGHRSVAEFFNPYLMIYTTEAEAKMQQFFENRITNKLEDRLVKLNAPKQVEVGKSMPVAREELKALELFENQVDEFNKVNEDKNIDLPMPQRPITLIDTPEVKNRSKSIADYLIKKSPSHESIMKTYDDYLAKTDKIIYRNYRNR